MWKKNWQNSLICYTDFLPFDNERRRNVFFPPFWISVMQSCKKHIVNYLLGFTGRSDVCFYSVCKCLETHLNDLASRYRWWSCCCLPRRRVRWPVSCRRCWERWAGWRCAWRTDPAKCCCCCPGPYWVACPGRSLRRSLPWCHDEGLMKFLSKGRELEVNIIEKEIIIFSFNVQILFKFRDRGEGIPLILIIKMITSKALNSYKHFQICTKFTRIINTLQGKLLKYIRKEKHNS